MKLRRAVVLLVLAVVAPACSFTARGSTQEVSDGGTPGQDAGAPVHDAGRADAAAPADASGADAAPPPADTGWVFIMSYTNATTALYSIDGQFTHGPNPNRANACPGQSFGPCTRFCASTSGPLDYVSAGTLNVTVGSSPFVVTQGQNLEYVTSGDYDIWTGNSGTVSVSGSGGEFPAFASTLGAPGSVFVNTPSLGVTWPRSEDLPVQWTWESGGGDVVVGVGLYGNAIECTFAGGANGSSSGTIPAAALANLASGNNDLTVYVNRTTLVPTSTGSVTITAATYADIAVGNSTGVDNTSIVLQ